MSKNTFTDLLEKTFSNKNNPCYSHWIDYQTTGLERGNATISQLESLGISVRDKVTLDLGCGTGALSIALKRHGAEVVSLDLSKKWLKMAKARAKEQKTHLNLIRACGEHLPLKQKILDLVFAMDVIEHVIDPRGCAKEIARSLKREGFLKINSPNAISPGYLRRDHEFQLPLISILPLWLAKKYARIARQVEEYDVNKIPTYKYIIKIFEEVGIDLFISTKDISRNIMDVTKIRSRKTKWLVSIIKKAGIPDSFILALYIYIVPEMWTFLGKHQSRIEYCSENSL